MNHRRIKLRLIALVSAIGLMGLAIGLMTVKSQREANRLRDQLGRVDSESFRIADQFKDFLRNLNNALYLYGSDLAPADLDKFKRASEELNLWIDRQKPRLTTAQEKAVMEQIGDAYDDYLRTTRALLSQMQARQTQGVTIKDYAGLRHESQRLSDLGQALARAHYGARGEVLAQANRAIAELRALVLVSLGFLFVFAVALGVVVYRDMISPLRVKLGQSQALAERHEKLASLGLLAAGVAHEIRNPLTAIKAALFLQLKRFQPGSPEHADAKVVEREIRRLERIVCDFLTFARPSDPQPTQASVEDIFREAHALLAPQLSAVNIQLVIEPAASLSVYADAAQIKQVLINLVQNAADAIGQNGSVKLRARRDRQPLNGGGQEVIVLEVADTGPGIAPEVQARLFDPFFTTKSSGSGLGLSIAAAIVQKHGGAIRYQTQVNHGTTFGIVLPQTIP